MLHSVAAVQLVQQYTVLPHNCGSNYCYEICKVISETLPLFYAFPKHWSISNEIFNKKRVLDCRRNTLLYLHSWNVVLKFTH